MYSKNKIIKIVSVVISILFSINNLTYAAPSTSTLRSSSALLTGVAPALGGDLIKVSELQSLGVDRARAENLIAMVQSGRIRLKGSMIDVIDENDNVIGAIDQDLAHNAWLRHRTSNIVIVHPDNGNILLQQRAKHKGAYPEHWAIYGGHVKAGQTYAEAAEDELKEELGLEDDHVLQGEWVFIGEEGSYEYPSREEPSEVSARLEDRRAVALVMQGLKNIENRAFYIYIPSKDEVAILEGKMVALRELRNQLGAEEAYDAELKRRDSIEKGRWEVKDAQWHSLKSITDGIVRAQKSLNDILEQHPILRTAAREEFVTREKEYREELLMLTKAGLLLTSTDLTELIFMEPSALEVIRQAISGKADFLSTHEILMRSKKSDSKNSKASSAGAGGFGMPAVGRLIDPGQFIQNGIVGAQADSYRADARPQATLAQMHEFIGKAGAITFEASLRGADLGSSMDLGRGPGMEEGLKELVTPREAKDLAEVAQTIVIPSVFTAKLRVSLLSAQEKQRYGEKSIVYISPLHSCPAEKPFIYKAPIKLVNGKAPRGQADMVAYILWNLNGLYGVKVEFDVYNPKAPEDKSYGVIATKAGGMGTSGGTNTLLHEAGSMISRRGLTISDCAAEAISDENTIAGGYTGGQEGYVATAAEYSDNIRTVDLIWIGGIKDADGNPKYHPHAALAVPMLTTQEDVEFIEDHAAIVQVGARFVKNPETGIVEKVSHRSASSINTGWMHSAETEKDAAGNDIPIDPVGAGYHRSKIVFVRDMRTGLIKRDITLLNRGNMGQVGARDNLSLREAELIVKGDSELGIEPMRNRLDDYTISDKIGLATYGVSDAERTKIERIAGPILQNEKAGQIISAANKALIDEMAIKNLSRLLADNISLYSDYAKDLFEAIEKEMREDQDLSMSAFCTGAGGDGGIIMLWSSKGLKHIEEFLQRRLGIKRFAAEEVIRVTTQTGGTLAGWMPFEVGNIGTKITLDNMTLEEAAELDFAPPASSPIMKYDEDTATYSKASSAGLLKFTNVSISEEQVAVLNSTENDAARIDLLKAIFLETFGVVSDVITKAPGRDNDQGEHVDYPDIQFKTGNVHLYSMGGAIQNNFIALVGQRDDNIIRIVHANAQEAVEFSLRNIGRLQNIAKSEREANMPAEDRQIPAWANHTMGVVIQALKRNYNISGMNILLTSNVPYGAGLSNSAANCCAVAMALNEAYSLGLSTDNIITFARDGEHDDFVGSSCGWLDQTIIMKAKAGQLVMIDYADMSVRYFKSKLPDTLQRVLVNTNMPHDLAATEYSDRSNLELPLAFKTLDAIIADRKIDGSTSLTLAELNHIINIFDGNAPIVDFNEAGIEGKMSQAQDAQQSSTNLPSDKALLLAFSRSDYDKPKALINGREEVISRHKGLTLLESFALTLRRMRHQLTSSLRTPLTGEAAEKGDVVAFGELINAEGKSLRMDGDFQITGNNGAQDALLDIGSDIAKRIGIECYGRMEGGGGGGNVGFYVDRSNENKYREWLNEVVTAYSGWTQKQGALRDKGIKATFIERELSAGAEVSAKASSAGINLKGLSDYDAQRYLATALVNYAPTGIIEVNKESQAIIVYSDSLKESPALQEIIRQSAGDSRKFFLVNKEQGISADQFLAGLNINKGIFENYVFQQNSLTPDQLALTIAGTLHNQNIRQGRVFASTEEDLSAWSKQGLIEALVMLLKNKRFEIISDYSQQHREYIRTYEQTLIAA